MKVATTLVTLLAGSAAVTGLSESAIFGKIIEGDGYAKAIQIKRVPGRPAHRLTDFSIAIAHNGRALDEDNKVYTFPRGRQFPEILYNTVTLCTEEAVEQDIGQKLCGRNPIILPSSSPVLSFNGNDMLVLRLDNNIIDYFGNSLGKKFKICGVRNANIKSILTRKEGVQRGQLEQLSAKTPCEWDYEPLTLPFPVQDFSQVLTFDKPVSKSSIQLRDGDDGGDVTELFLSAPGVKKIRIKDMEKGPRPPKMYGLTTVCIKQEKYLFDQESKCSYLWDADLGSTDPETGLPIPFDFTLSGTFRGDFQTFIKRFYTAKHSLSLAECTVTTENPVDTKFKNYIYNYTCYDDCETLDKQWDLGAECRASECIAKQVVWGGDCDVDYKETPVVPQCGAGTFCSSNFGDMCQSETMLFKMRSINAENMVIPAGEKRTVNFFIDKYDGRVSNGGRIHFITTAAAKLSYNVTVTDSGDVLGSSRSLVDLTCEPAPLHGDAPATAYYHYTTRAYLQSDDTFSGLWGYTVTNEGTEDITLLGAYKDFDSTFD